MRAKGVEGESDHRIGGTRLHYCPLKKLATADKERGDQERAGGLPKGSHSRRRASKGADVGLDL